MINTISKHFPIFIVGGAVRNDLMGISPKDIDYCVEATVEEFERIFPTLKKVGDSFPVYLCPITSSEIALTRNEKSTGNGYQDFEFVAGVSIEDDLSRRDLTINAIAKNVLTGELVDPHNGIHDIEHGLIRTHNEKSFLEDPLRILRAIRFAMEFDFAIEPATFQLMYEAAHLLVHITPERILLELEKVYERCDVPANFFRIMDELNALHIHFPELHDAKEVITGRPEHHPEIYNSEHLFNSFNTAKRNGFSFSVAIAALCHDMGKNLTPADVQPRHVGHELKIEYLEGFFAKHRFDSHTMKLAKVVFRLHMRIHDLCKMRDIKKIKFVRRVPKYLRAEFINACNCDAPLSKEQFDTFFKVCVAIDTATIDIPKEILARGKDSIDEFVNNCIFKRFKEIN